MFTTTMSIPELIEEARKDYKEMYCDVRIAYERFSQNYRTYRNESRRLIHTMAEEKTYRTRQNNTWTIHFRYILEKSGKAQVIGLMYMPFRRESGIDYFYMSINRQAFQLNIMSAHFIQRYKERYLDYNGITVKGPNLITYYIIHNIDRQVTRYMPKGWTEEDMQEKRFLISSQGLALVKWGKEYVLHITFLDQENLSRYKAIVYEQEQLWKLIGDLHKLWNSKEPSEMLLFKEKAIYHKIFSNPNSKKLFMDYVRRRKMGEPKEVLDEFLERAKGAWGELERNNARLGDALDSAERTLRPKTLFDNDLFKILRPRIDLFNKFK